MPVRKVSHRGGNAIGRFPSIKMGRMIAFESLLERDFIYLLDFDPSVEWFEEQPLTIEYMHETKPQHYTPDFRLFEAGQHVLIECKPECLVDTDENRRKFTAAQDWCDKRGWEIRTVTDRQVRSGYRLQNVRLLTQYARQSVDPLLRSRIYAFLQNVQPSRPIREIARTLLPANQAAVTASLLHLVYHHALSLPLDSAPISEDTVVFLSAQEERQR